MLKDKKVHAACYGTGVGYAVRHDALDSVLQGLSLKEAERYELSVDNQYCHLAERGVIKSVHLEGPCNDCRPLHFGASIKQPWVKTWSDGQFRASQDSDVEAIYKG